ncbi:NAD-binding protein [Streptomyces albidoflavus]|uniref:Potassium transporter TrkA n=1 Tax=Streptomyces albidoflavus TaxID=1886 RepID=A0ABY3GW35_9ACTN|nr:MULTISPECIES: NAD-binding protein [Streptomyces]MBO1287230.1 NAD-binding protein [Streptomyces sampsonii]MYW56953.1 potassium transporter TrkA [Streptomyces sp. SID8370]MYW86586.1 potassium transporter TrkA [Streptomyces sp. SID8371]MBV7653081.1 NAD-binding protein [Streptomyces albidoflavus]MBV7708587.1 NAD-binding protein [Streptomyces albidoflavus]
MSFASTPSSSLPSQSPPAAPHMVVCGDDALAQRLAAELADVYRVRVVLLTPAGSESRSPGLPGAARPPGRASLLLGRVSSVMNRNGGPATANGPTPPPAPQETRRSGQVRVVDAPAPDDEAFAVARVHTAEALALVYDDDETNIHAALRARRLNPRLRLVIRLYNRKLGQHLEELLEQAAHLAGLEDVDAGVTVMSDADTAAPALAAAAVAGSSKVVEADGILLRAAERDPSLPRRPGDPPPVTLALLSATVSDPAGSEGSDSDGDTPTLLPDDTDVADSQSSRATVVLERVGTSVPQLPRRRLRRRLRGRGAPLGSLFSRQLRWSVAGLVAAVCVLAVVAIVTTDERPLHAMHMTLLDLLAINEPAVEDGEVLTRKILQLLASVVGMLLLPFLLAAVLEALGTFRTATHLRRPPRGLSGHVVLLGLGKVGSRVLSRLHEMEVPVVCVEEDPEARGIALARRLRVPTVIGDVTEEGVLEAAKVHRARALLALTSVDSTNLEAVLYARGVKQDLRVVMRLFDDAFATAVYRTLRAAHPQARTRSRSVSTLSAPAFAVAMMGRQILGAVPVERRVLVFAALDVAGHPEFEDRTVEEAFRPGSWRVVALDAARPDERRDHLGAVPGERRPPTLAWDIHPGYVLRAQDRVVLVATRQGLGELLGRQGMTDPAGRF